MAILLESWGVSVLDVASQDEALTLLGDIGVAPDVLLVDYQLDRGENGLEAIAALRRRHGPLPAALITANRSSELRKACQARGIGFLNKPIESDSLRRLLRSIRPQQQLAGD